jgi:hypothetical protein
MRGPLPTESGHGLAGNRTASALRLLSPEMSGRSGSTLRSPESTMNPSRSQSSMRSPAGPAGPPPMSQVEKNQVKFNFSPLLYI